ncbi:MAG TPA: HlyD family efflux transporter periplasmic adaptor subunit [Steroidobacteraceae bacterium]|nr:HlyD family efflux transporter periplasmic adaptor subunit [Steroidobacteraceae bacterium]
MHAKVPVTITHPSVGSLAEPLVLNAVASYQRKNIIAAPVQGYVLSVAVNPGDVVSKGQSLFELQTKESHALSGSRMSDSLAGYSGKLEIKAAAAGIVTSVLRQVGDYVQDGDQLCQIADAGSFAFVLNVPLVDVKFVHIRESGSLKLPEGTLLTAHIGKILSAVDPASQTQQYLLTMTPAHTVPENVIAQVQLVKQIVPNAVILPRSAVLADEAMRSFWLMKLINDSTAVKVPIEKGIEMDSVIEIRSPKLSPDDRIVLTGNYGLDDTATVHLNSREP